MLQTEGVILERIPWFFRQKMRFTDRCNSMVENVLGCNQEKGEWEVVGVEIRPLSVGIEGREFDILSGWPTPDQ
jgi:hypothetical protein